MSRKPPNTWDIGFQGLAGGCSTHLSRVHVFKPAVLEAQLQAAASCCGLCAERRFSTLQTASTKPSFCWPLSCAQERRIWEDTWWWLCRVVIQSLPILQSNSEQWESHCPSVEPQQVPLRSMLPCLAEINIWPHQPVPTLQCGYLSHDHIH